MLSIERKNKFKDPVIITGTIRSGKGMLAPIVTSLFGNDRFIMDMIIEQYPMLHYLNLISEDTAIFLMRFSYERLVYNDFIGRNSNFRLGDMSSIWNSNDPKDYFMRLSRPEGDEIIKLLEQKKKTFIINFHNSLMNAKFFFKCFPSLKMIHMKRNPVDLIHSWYLKGYGSDEFWLNPRNATPTFKCGKNIVPYYAVGWEHEYMKMNAMDRVVNMIDKVSAAHHKSYGSLSQEEKKQIIIIPFEKFVVEPAPMMSELSSFLKSTLTHHVETALQQANVPRIIDKTENTKKEKEIKRKSSVESHDTLIKLMHDYESEKIVL